MPGETGRYRGPPVCQGCSEHWGYSSEGDGWLADRVLNIGLTVVGCGAGTGSDRGEVEGSLKGVVREGVFGARSHEMSHGDAVT